MISLNSAVQTIIYLVVVGLVFWMLSYLIDYVSPPEPFHKVAKIIPSSCSRCWS